MARRARGSVIPIKGRPGHYCRWRYTVSGKRKETVRYGGATKREAARKLADVDRLVHGGATLKEAIARVWNEQPKQEAVTFADVCQLYLDNLDRVRGRRRSQRTWTSDRVRWRVERIKAAPWASCHAHGVPEADVRRWVGKRQAEGASDATILNDLSQASAALKAAMAPEHAWLAPDADNPFLRARPTGIVKRPRPWFDGDELVAFLETARETVAEEPLRLMQAAAFTGWRLGDLALLRCDDVTPDYAVKGRKLVRLKVRAEVEKTGTGKVAFLDGALGAWVAERVRSRLAGARVFTQRHGASWEDPRRINRRVRAVLEAINDENVPHWKKWGDDVYLPFTFHCMRHTVDTILLKEGIPPHVVEALLGWKGDARSMSRHYAHVDEADLVGALGAMTRVLEGNTKGEQRSAGV